MKLDELLPNDITGRILQGECIETLKTLPAGIAQCCVTSPPYFQLRDYGSDEQIGLEETPEAYIAKLIEVFRGVRRVLRDDGTLWLNLGDCYAGSRSGPQGQNGEMAGRAVTEQRIVHECYEAKPKDLMMIPAQVALALRADGWYLRKDIIWSKPNPIPESITDRPTSAHEHVFLLAKEKSYFYDLEAIREPPKPENMGKMAAPKSGPARMITGTREQNFKQYDEIKGANARDVWEIQPQSFEGAHFATMPPMLAERCIKAGSKEGDIVLDPFGGAGTTGFAAARILRRALLIELNPEYVTLAKNRLTKSAYSGFFVNQSWL